MTEAVLGILAALVGLATALVSAWQLRKQRERETTQPTSVHYYFYGQPPAGPPPGAGDAFYSPVPSWTPPHGGPPPQPPGVPSQPLAAAPSAAPPLERRRPEIWAAVRDASLIFATSALLGAVLVFATGSIDLTTVGVLNIACLLVGFTISAVRARGNRARHLLIAGLTTWFLGLLNVAAGVAGFDAWVYALVLIAVCAALAGSLSLLLKPRRG